MSSNQEIDVRGTWGTHENPGPAPHVCGFVAKKKHAFPTGLFGLFEESGDYNRHVIC